MNDILRPSREALSSLLTDITSLLGQLQFVRKILCFGSLATDTWDCWSDIDLIVVTETRPQFIEILDVLEKTRPILHRNRFIADADPSGGHILGILFDGYSVFHTIDLNLLTYQDYQAVGALERFGVTRELYRSELPALIKIQDSIEVTSEQEDPDEARIKVAVHFTKKATKKVLRGEDFYPNLVDRCTYLKQVMADYPADLVINGRHIGALAQSYIEISDSLLQAQ